MQQSTSYSSSLLVEPKLYVAGVKEAVPDAGIVQALHECLRVRPRIERSTGNPDAMATGYIEFESLDRAERAFATVNGQILREHSCTLELRVHPSAENPRPTAEPRLFKSLPPSTTAGGLFDVCRKFGPVFRVTMGSGADASSVPKGQAIVVFLNEADAATATSELHCSELDGQTIIVQAFDQKCGRSVDPTSKSASYTTLAASSTSTSQWAHPSASSKPAFAGRASLNSSATPYSPPSQGSPFGGGLQRSTRSHSFTSQTSAHSAKTSATAATSTASNPCNLFIKSLDPTIDTKALFELFRPYGTITSARVMTDPDTRASKEFGFVAYQKPEQAAAAMAAMDGAKIGSNVIVVRIHELKAARQARLEQEVQNLQQAKLELQTKDGDYRGGPSGGSSFADQRSAPSPALRQSKWEPVAATKPQDEPDPWSTPAPWSKPAAPKPEKPTTPSTPVPAVQTTPAPAPVPAAANDNDQHSAAADGPEAERIKQAVLALGPPRADEIVRLLVQLPKKYRAMCLVNKDYMRETCADALAVFGESDNIRSQEAAAKAKSGSKSAQGPGAVSGGAVAQPRQNGHGPSNGNGASAAASVRHGIYLDDDDEEEEEDEFPRFVAELALMPVERIMSLEDRFPELGIQVVSKEKRKEMDEFLDSMNGMRLHEVKQKLGEVLFKAVKATGAKGAPRKTIHLLDTEELRPLACLIDYPAILKEVVARVPPPQK